MRLKELLAEVRKNECRDSHGFYLHQGPCAETDLADETYNFVQWLVSNGIDPRDVVDFIARNRFKDLTSK